MFPRGKGYYAQQMGARDEASHAAWHIYATTNGGYLLCLVSLPNPTVLSAQSLLDGDNRDAYNPTLMPFLLGRWSPLTILSPGSRASNAFTFLQP